MANWSIKIVNAGFQPNLKDARPGDTLQVNANDNITWNNTTNDKHWPWPVDSNGNPVAPQAGAALPASGYYFGDEIAPGSVSSPIFNVPAGLPSGAAIHYCCRYNPALRGTIIVGPTTTAGTPVA